MFTDYGLPITDSPVSKGDIIMAVSGITALYLTFQMEDETFALDVSQVREILDWTSITKVPRAPDFMRGVINVRGSVVPVMDLRMKFGMPQKDCTVDTRIMIMEVTLEDKVIVLGAIADSVNDVLELESNQIEEPPEIGAQWRSEYIKGIGKQDKRFIIILDVNRVFSSDDLRIAQDAGGKSTEGSEDTILEKESVTLHPQEQGPGTHSEVPAQAV